MATVLEILVIESNPGDVRLVREMFKDSRIHNSMTVVGDLKQTMAFLRKEGSFAQANSPDVIFLSLMMLMNDGYEIWKAILENEAYKSIPLVLVSSSQDEQDMLKRHNIMKDTVPASYVVKPIDLKQLLATVHDIDNFGLALTKVQVFKLEAKV
jgi:CheY-like chemotaxis protein